MAKRKFYKRFKKFYKSYKKSKRYYKRRPMRRRRNTIRLPYTGPSPQAYFCKLRYHEDQSFTANATTNTGSYVWSGNGLYDPNQTGTGHQPTGFDQISAMYYNYLVMGSKIRFTCNVVPSAPMATPCNLIFSADTQSALNNQYTLPNGTYRQVIENPSATSPRPIIVKLYKRTKGMFGVRSVQEEDDYQASVTANPARQWYWIIMCDNIRPGSVNLTVNVSVDITYYCRFNNRVVLLNS